MRNRLEITAEDHEATYVSNHLSPVLLTRRLLPALFAAASERHGAARIIGVSSSRHHHCPGIDWTDPQLKQGWASGRSYCLAKLCNMLFLTELARRLPAERIVVNAMHPGEVSSNFTSHAPPEMRAATSDAPRVPPEIPADTILWMASAPEAGGFTGRYLHQKTECATSPLVSDTGLAKRLWEADARTIAEGGFELPTLPGDQNEA